MVESTHDSLFGTWLAGATEAPAREIPREAEEIIPLPRILFPTSWSTDSLTETMPRNPAAVWASALTPTQAYQLFLAQARVWLPAVYI